MATQTFGPVGALYYGTIRRAAFELNLTLTQLPGFLHADSLFRVTGDLESVAKMTRYVQNLAKWSKEQDRLAAIAGAKREADRKARKRWWRPLTWFD